MTVRRTKEQIAAGFPHELAKKGINFEEWLEKQEDGSKSKEDNKKITRRTKEQIKAGFPLELAANGINFKDWLKEQQKKEIKENFLEKEADISHRDKKIIIPPPEEPKSEKKERVKTEYIKHTETIILENNKGNSTKVEELVYKALDNCKWEWKRIPIDNKFHVQDLDKYGKDGWKMAFILEKEFLPNLKDPIMCFQRPIKNKEFF